MRNISTGYNAMSCALYFNGKSQLFVKQEQVSIIMFLNILNFEPRYCYKWYSDKQILCKTH